MIDVPYTDLDGIAAYSCSGASPPHCECPIGYTESMSLMDGFTV